MAKNPLERAHNDAQKDIDRLGELFGKLGNIQNPDTPLLSAYKHANTLLVQTLQAGGGVQDVRSITRDLKKLIQAEVTPILKTSRTDGAESARRQLSYYGLAAKELKPDEEMVASIYGVIDSKVQEQETALTALVLGEADQSLITGDDSRQGVLRPFDVITTAAFWIAWLFWEGFSSQAGKSKGVQFQKQVVAALDHRTTDCCLRAHGQIVDINQKFKLTGTPRFADELEWTPFHNFCRSSVVLYLPGYDDGLTDRMREDAQTVLEERASGVNKYRHPSSAFIKK